ncbi:MAG TPA: STAS domain-containing protein [Acidimicrobiales bacterium]|nr:STAS domain-containing protein [Acidimicrobiales bacterium]
MSLETIDGVPVLSASGEIDLSNASLLLEQIAQLPTGATKLVIDLSSVTFLDSSGLAALVACAKRLSGSGQRCVVVCTLQIAKLVDLTGLGAVFEIMPTREEAISAISS